MRPFGRVVTRLVCALFLSRVLGAQPSAPKPKQAQSADVSVYLLTMGVGHELWMLFGHDAIWIHDPRNRIDEVYDWGRFDFRQQNFLGRFIKGAMLYSGGDTTMDFTLFAYTYWHRKLVAQQLDLTPAQIQVLRSDVDSLMRPENRPYHYDYYRNNCATRVRDLIDRAIGGQLRAAATTQMTGTTYRSQTLRLMQPDFWLTTGVDIGLGRPGDQPLSAWDEMFLPYSLHDFLNAFKVRDSSGAVRPLVKSDVVLLQGQEPAAGPAAPPPILTWLMALGFGVAAVLAVTLVVAGRFRPLRIVAGILASFWCVAAGILGLLLTLLWTVTDHVFAHNNASLLVFHPLWLALAVTLPMFVISGRARAITRALVLLSAAAAAIALLAHVTGLSQQDNLAVIWLGLPTTFVLAALVLRRDLVAPQAL